MHENPNTRPMASGWSIPILLVGIGIVVGTIYFYSQNQRLEQVEAELTYQGRQIDRLSRELTEHIDAHAIEHARQAQQFDDHLWVHEGINEQISTTIKAAAQQAEGHYQLHDSINQQISSLINAKT